MKSIPHLINGAIVALLCSAPAWVPAQDTGRPADGAAGATEAARPATDTDDSAVRAIVQKADEARLPRDPFQVDVVVNTVTGGQAQEPRRYRVLSRGNENTIILTIDPATERGQNLLMKGRSCF